jgi:hypothetical protein
VPLQAFLKSGVLQVAVLQEKKLSLLPLLEKLERLSSES